MTGAAAGGATPYYRSPSGDVTLYRGDAPAVLRALPAGSVHTCITSVPYYALRAYGTEPQVWGGEATCDHDWGATLRTPWANSVPGPNGLGGKNAAGRNEDKYHGAFCARCGAWRGELGLEPTPGLYVEHIVAVFRAVSRVLRDDGCLWLNIGDSYCSTAPGTSNAPMPKGSRENAAQWANFRPETPDGMKPKDLMGIPWLVAFALRADGWYLRSDIVWSKPNPMPESVRDRPTRSHEYIFLLSKGPRYFFDQEAVREPGREWAGQAGTFARSNGKAAALEVPGQSHASHRAERDDRVAAGRNIRSVWEIATEPYPEAHFATFPTKLVEPCLLSGTSARGCCPACGAPWTRETEMVDSPADAFRNSGRYVSQGVAVSNSAHDGGTPRGKVRGATTGWRAGCGCADAGDPLPAVCLDPFAGSGTVGVVARKHGRHFIGIDLSAAYLDLARERLGQLALPGWSGVAAGG